MLSRRLSLAAAYWLVASIRNKLLADSTYQVRIRADDVVKGSVPPVALEDLHIEPDRSTEAQALAQRAPVGRAVPLFVWIIGVVGAPLVWQFVREQVRQYWYGGVLIDGRTTPVTITNDLRIPGDMVLIIEATTTAGFERYLGWEVIQHGDASRCARLGCTAIAYDIVTV